jgi:hypothetical protein
MTDKTSKIPFTCYCSATGVRKLALSIFVAYLVSHFLGWREDTHFISGTIGPDAYVSVFRGLFYVLLYYGAVLLAPVLLIASFIYQKIDQSPK